MLVKLSFLFVLLHVVNCRVREIIPYTMVAYSTYGKPCIGGCSPSTFECVVKWNGRKEPCTITNEPAPIYYTSQFKGSHKYCLSNCGKFGYGNEWCITTLDIQWDYCSSHKTSVAGSGRQYDAHTRKEWACNSDCAKNGKRFFWCYWRNKRWDYCAPSAMSRLPVLPSSFNSGQSCKGTCNPLLERLTNHEIDMNIESSSAYDGYLSETAEALEAVADWTPNFSSRTVNSPRGAIKSYISANMVLSNGQSVDVPVIIRARVDKSTMQQLSFTPRSGGDDVNEDGPYELYVNRRLVGDEIGGPSDKYNYVPMSSKLKEFWSKSEQAMSAWCDETGGSVDLLIVVFYSEFHSRMPRALGIDLTFNNNDGSHFVNCKDTVYFNRL